MNLFVYGTLRNHRPGPPHRMAKLLAEGADFIGHGCVQGLLYDLGEYPGLIPAVGDFFVHGEVYAIKDSSLPEVLEALDNYEGDQYLRKELTVTLSNDEDVVRMDTDSIPAQVYILRKIHRGSEIIPSGDYFKR